MYLVPYYSKKKTGRILDVYISSKLLGSGFTGLAHLISHGAEYSPWMEMNVTPAFRQDSLMEQLHLAYYSNWSVLQ